MAIFTYSYRKNQLNLVKYAIHGFYGNRRVAVNFLWTKVVELFHGPSIAGDVGVVSWGPQQALRLRRFKHPNMHQNAADWRWMICDAWQLSYIPDCSAYQEFWSYLCLVAFQKSKCRHFPPHRDMMFLFKSERRGEAPEPKATQSLESAPK